MPTGTNKFSSQQQQAILPILHIREVHVSPGTLMEANTFACEFY